jgi:hypothetical protein
VHFTTFFDSPEAWYSVRPAALTSTIVRRLALFAVEMETLLEAAVEFATANRATSATQ